MSAPSLLRRALFGPGKWEQKVNTPRAQRDVTKMPQPKRSWGFILKKFFGHKILSEFSDMIL
jgi:hypothetical protein